jgi:hypothetical protein
MNKTYKVRGVEFTVNSVGCLLHCSDWESVYEPNGKDAWRGTNADLFKMGFGGKFFATPKFYQEAL